MESLIAELPEWARALFYVVLAVGGGALFLVGKSRPEKADSPKTDPRFELQAAMVDNRSVDKLSGEVTGQAIAITAQTLAIKDQTAAIIAMTTLGRDLIRMHEEEEERKADRERDRLERENDDLRRKLAREGDPMRRD